jgi:SpoVK/Ycf46/Vps4 family AAA+-type ATPase
MSNLDSLREAVRQSPSNVPLLLLYGQACLDEYAYDEARVTFKQVLDIQPANLEGSLGLAKLLHLSGKTSEAVVRTEVIVESHPQTAAPRIFLARLLLTEGQRREARQHYEAALKLAGATPDKALERELYEGGEPMAQTADGRAAPVSAAEETEEAERAKALRQFSNDPGVDAELERPKVTFADVGGNDHVKEEIRMKIIYPMQNPDLFRAYGKKIGGGMLLYGPPGCGKTLISRATAGEIKANFISIGIHQILDMWIGSSEKNLHEVFELARSNSPTVLFFDEVDALAADRTDLKRSAGRALINVFLAEMDGTNANNDGLLILGATNAPWHIDSAFRREGRFGRVLFVPPPDETARIAIIEVMAHGKPVAGLDAKTLAKATKDFSGADLKAVFDLATEQCLAAAMKKGEVVPITTKDLVAAAKSFRPTTKAWFESAKNYALYANQGGFYDDILKYLGIKL